MNASPRKTTGRLSSDSGGEHPASWSAARLRSECDVRFTRRRGPGGQHRNKVETAVILRHRSSDIQAEASEKRAQGENLRTAISRLRLRLALGLRYPWLQASPLWQRRCSGGRIAVSKSHTDFPTLLAEALDALDAHHWDATAAVEALGCSKSQLIRLLRQHPAGLALLNQHRAEQGIRPLK